jgi:hypothetical protein
MHKKICTIPLRALPQKCLRNEDVGVIQGELICGKTIEINWVEKY